MYAVISLHIRTDAETKVTDQENHEVRPFADLVAAQSFAVGAKERFESVFKKKLEAEDAAHGMSGATSYQFGACRIYNEKGDLLFHIRDDGKLVDSKADKVVSP